MHDVDVTVVSTGFRAATKERCLDSVAAQRGIRVDHVYVEASEQSPPRTPLQNQYDSIATLPPTRVVVLLDGDDWLANSHCLQRVVEEHEDGAWVTYGSFVYANGRPGFAAPVGGHPRRLPWTSTHLKSLRAGLVQRIRMADMMAPEKSPLRGEGGWLWAAADVALMLPCLEMASPSRARFLSDILCIYETAGSWHVSAAPEKRGLEAASARYIRSFAPYRPLESLS